MPIDDNIYDFVYSCDMLEHIRKDNREKAINEAIRVCRN
jgi:ubiquinone/menaquinone biosynthesis C-methylase UbiE